MRQNIGDVEDRIAVVLADADRLFLSSAEHNHAVQSKRNCRPLILFDTPVVVRFEIAEPLFLVHRIGLQIKTGRVDVGNHNSHAVLSYILRADAD